MCLNFGGIQEVESIFFAFNFILLIKLINIRTFLTKYRQLFMKSKNEICDTIFYQGMLSSQTQILKYIGDKKIKATTGETMWCEGMNNLKPLKVIYKAYIGKEDIPDVNLKPFDSYTDMINPVNVVGAAITNSSNKKYGMHVSPSVNPAHESVKYHAPVISNISIGQETDINSHCEKYKSWKTSENKSEGLILYGVSRGTAATFCAFAREKYPEVKLVILEGAIDSIPNVFKRTYNNKFGNEKVSNLALYGLNTFFSTCTQYKPDGISPLSCVAEYPENVPTVFITSKIDAEVPCENTRNIATKLANRGKNDVYLLELEKSKHPQYMFDNQSDRDNYEAFIHAIYKKYGLKHDQKLAEKGAHLVDKCQLKPQSLIQEHPEDQIKITEEDDLDISTMCVIS